MTSKYYNRFWVMFTIVLFSVLALILLPMMIREYGLIGAIVLSPLLLLAAALAYFRGYWVSRWISEWRDKRKDQRL